MQAGSREPGQPLAGEDLMLSLWVTVAVEHASSCMSHRTWSSTLPVVEHDGLAGGADPEILRKGASAPTQAKATSHPPVLKS
jgi:hypothetical protein